MSEQIPDPSKRSFMHRLVQSFFDVVQEWNALTAEWNAPPRQPAQLPALTDLFRQQINALRQLPPAYLVLLLTFDKPRLIDDLSHVPDQFKTLAVFQPKGAREACERLQASGTLVRSDLPIHLAERFSGDELQAMCKARELPRYGNKSRSG